MGRKTDGRVNTEDGEDITLAPLANARFPDTWRHDPNNDEHIYKAVARSESPQARFARGTAADVSDIGSNKGINRIIKWDKRDQPPLVGLEAEIYAQLQDLDFPHMPKTFDLDTESIEMERLGDGLSLEDFAVAAASGLISENKWVDICKRCKKVIEEFHDLGMIHGDLHAGNIVIVLDTDKGFVPYLIDFAFSSHTEDVDKKIEQLEDRNVQFSQDHDFSQEGDWKRLENGLANLMREQASTFSRGILALFS